MTAKREGQWWKNAVFYQIYPKSFQDTNGDGIGDLEGVIQHLDYLASLGIDGIWLSAVNESPQKDNGYDVSDYYAIWTVFGNVDDMERLISEADKRGLIVVMDLVLNHTSDQHEWFQQARQGKDNPYHNYYIWRDGAEGTPPDDLEASFGGSAWTWDPQAGQFYYSSFSPYQPDLNWDNPEVREEMHKVMRYWIDKGIGGFRIDAIPFISKDLDKGVAFLGPHLHEYVHEMHEKAFPDPAFFTTGEDGLCDIEDAVRYTDPKNQELSAVFEFAEPDIDPNEWGWEMKWTLHPLYLPGIKKQYERWQTGIGDGWTTPCMGNHDIPRISTWWGAPDEYRPTFSKALGAVLMGLRGTPFIYQGEEIGMTGVQWPIEQYVDIDTHNFYKESETVGRDMDEVMERIHINSRDNARTPVQWTAGKNAGFSTAQPWLPVNRNHTRINVQAQEDDPDSVLNFYRRMIQIRKTEQALLNGGFELLDPDSEDTFCYARTADGERIIIASSFTDQEREWPEPDDIRDAELLLSNYEPSSGPLRPYEVRVLKQKVEK